MKKLFSALLILSVFACKEEAAPILGDVLQGSYNVTIVKISGLPLSVPFTNPTNGQTLSGTIKVTKKTDDSATGIVTLIVKDSKGTQETPYDQGTFTLTGDGSKLINIMKDNVQTGTYDVGLKTLNIKSNVPNPLDGGKIASAEITAVKQ